MNVKHVSDVSSATTAGYLPDETMRISYDALNTGVLPHIPLAAKSILDLGCGTGALGACLKGRQDCRVVGVTYSHDEAQTAGKALDEVIVADLNTINTKDLGRFDCIVSSHVLEHLYQPQTLLERLRPNFTPDGVLVVALPNILDFKQRFQFLRGRFRYTDGGLMDKTHFRFFDHQTAYDLVRDAGYSVSVRAATGNFPLPGIRKVLRGFAKAADKQAVRLWPSLFAHQFIIVGRPA